MDRQRGRFRNFLMAAVMHFLSHERDKALAKCRGGARKIVPLESETAETRYSLEPADRTTPEQLYECQRYRRALRGHIAHTVAGPEAVDEELLHLLRALAGKA